MDKLNNDQLGPAEIVDKIMRKHLGPILLERDWEKRGFALKRVIMDTIEACLDAEEGRQGEIPEQVVSIINTRRSTD